MRGTVGESPPAPIAAASPRAAGGDASPAASASLCLPAHLQGALAAAKRAVADGREALAGTSDSISWLAGQPPASVIVDELFYCRQVVGGPSTTFLAARDARSVVRTRLRMMTDSEGAGAVTKAVCKSMRGCMQSSSTDEDRGQDCPVAEGDTMHSVGGRPSPRSPSASHGVRAPHRCAGRRMLS